MLAAGGLIDGPVLDRPDSMSTAAARVSSCSSADGCLPTCSPHLLSQALSTHVPQSCPCPCSAVSKYPKCKCVLFWV